MEGPAVLQTDLGSHLPLVARGKVREVWKIDEARLLFVATDRISAYDVILKNGIPYKGALLTIMTTHWLSLLKKMMPHLQTHFISLDLPAEIEALPQIAPVLKQRSMQVRNLEVLPIESIVRGYITGSAWSEYQKSRTVHGMPMPSDLRESEKLVKPLWTPSTKAEQGAKDENISPQQAVDLIGEKYARKVEELSLAIYVQARDYALARGIIIADTKLEFGVDRSNDSVVLIDEVLTPDSSRFWPVKGYELGKSQKSFDKQYLRDWLTANGLKGKEGVEMPPEVVQKTADGYREAFERLVGMRWDVTRSQASK